MAIFWNSFLFSTKWYYSKIIQKSEALVKSRETEARMVAIAHRELLEKQAQDESEASKRNVNLP